MLLTALALFSFLVFYFGFAIPILLQFFFYGALTGVLYFGTQLQIIGLTGGISTGKSTVSQVLSENGFDIIDADKIAREVSILLLYICWDIFGEYGCRMGDGFLSKTHIN